ncbi:MAG: hypothetical protein GY737_02910 [Desulfobacteraceae bacterium]|nr:hypothetical protein [Desulfobacteraceae bacterium]
MKNSFGQNVNIAVEIGTAEQLNQVDVAIFDRIYIGNPYCLDFKDNLLTSKGKLSDAIIKIKNLGVQPIVSLIAMPRNKHLGLFDKIVDISLEAGVQGFEVHSAGALYRLSKNKKLSDCEIVIGGFANVYTKRTAQLFSKLSATLIMPNYELPLETIDSISSEIEAPFELLIHGKIPLGLSESCLLLEKSKELNTSCPDSCTAGFWLDFNRWSLKNFGKLTCSGKDLCLLPQLKSLIEKGYADFRISGLTETAETINRTGSIYRNYVNKLRNGSVSEFGQELNQLEEISKKGFCNGYLFGKSGCEWVAYEN